MKQLWITLFVAGAVAVAGAQNHSQSQKSAQSSSSHPRRVRMAVSGFDLSPTSSANQIGGASRGVGNSKHVVLYAPHKGQSYTLRPSFWWGGDPNATYKLHLQALQGTLSWDRQVTGTSANYPADAPPLKPGKTYLWRVESQSSLFGPPAPSAILVVLPETERAQVTTEESKITGSDEQAGIARAKVFYNHKLWYDTLMAYNSLIAKYPNDPALVKMRDNLYEQLPVTRNLAKADATPAK